MCSELVIAIAVECESRDGVRTLGAESDKELEKKQKKNNVLLGECLPCVCEALGSILSTTQTVHGSGSL